MWCSAIAKANSVCQLLIMATQWQRQRVIAVTTNVACDELYVLPAGLVVAGHGILAVRSILPVSTTAKHTVRVTKAFLMECLGPQVQAHLKVATVDNEILMTGFCL